MVNEKKIFFAAKAFILQDGKFLAMHRSDTCDDWLELPGGRMEFGEDYGEQHV